MIEARGIAAAPLPQALDAGDTPDAAPSRRMVGALAVLAFVLALAWLPVQLTLPLGREQSIIGLVGARMLDGLWPYAESWDHRGPVAYGLYAALIWLCGDVPTASRAGDLLFLAIAAGALESIGRSLAQPWLAPLGAVILVLVVRDAQAYGHPDLWLASLWLWVLAGFLDARHAPRLTTYAAAGAAVGVASMLKPVYALLLALPLLLALREGAPRRATVAIAAAAATVAAIGAVFAANDRLQPLIQVYLGFNFFGHAGPADDTIPVALLRFLVNAVAPWFDVGAAAITVTAILGARAMARRDRGRTAVLGLAWALGLGCVMLQGKSHLHHFAFANVVVAVFAAYAMSRALHWLAAAAARESEHEFSLRLVLCGAVAIAGIALALQVHAARAANWWSARLGLISEAVHAASYCRREHCPVDTRNAAELIRRETDRTTPIFLFGTDAGLYLAAGRPPATRFLTAYPLVAGPRAWTQRMRGEAIAALRASPPHFIVVQDFDAMRTRGRLTSRQHLERFPELRALIAERYDMAHHLGRFVVYRVKHAVVAGLATHAPVPQ